MMTESHYGRRALAWGMIGLAALLSACATMKASPEEQVSQRAQQRWDLIMGDDLDAAYAYFAPGYRSGMPLKSWQRKMLTRRVVVNDAEVSGSECDGETCEVSVAAKYTAHGALPGVSKYDNRTAITEDWVRVDGQWFYLPDD